MPELQCVPGLVRFFRTHRGQAGASSALTGPMSRHFVAAMDQFIEREGIEVMRFRRGERKDHVMAERLRKFLAEEGIIFTNAASTTLKRRYTHGQKKPNSPPET
jgi:hypothetical protein